MCVTYLCCISLPFIVHFMFCMSWSHASACVCPCFWRCSARFAHFVRSGLPLPHMLVEAICMFSTFSMS